LIDDPGSSNQDVTRFVPYVAGRPFRFHLTGIDVTGRTVEWSMPLWFIDRGRNTVTDLRSVIDVHEHVTFVDGSRTRIQVGEAPPARQGVAVAPEGPDTEPDATTVEADAIVFSARAPDALAGETQDEPRFVPVVESATVVIPSVSRLTGTTEPATVSYAG